MPEKEQEERLLGFLQGLVREDPVPTKVSGYDGASSRGTDEKENPPAVWQNR